MKKYRLILVVLLFHINCYGNKDQQLVTIKQIENIRKLFKDCNDSIQHFRSIETYFFEETAEGGHLVGYFKHDKLKKLVVTFMGETGSAKYEYYFHENHLYFAFYSLMQYNKPFYEEQREILKNEENRFYFFENSLVRWIDEKGNHRLPNEAEYKRKERNVLIDMKEYREKIPN